MVDWYVTGLWLLSGLRTEKTIDLDSVGKRAWKCDRETRD